MALYADNINLLMENVVSFQTFVINRAIDETEALRVIKDEAVVDGINGTSLRKSAVSL